MSTASSRQRQTVDSSEATIVAGQTESNAVNFFGVRAVGISVPTLVGVTEITFKVSLDGGVTYQELCDPDSNTPVSVTVDGTARSYFLHARHFAGIRFLKVVIDTTQASDKEFLLALLEL